MIVCGSREWDDEAVVEHTRNGWLFFDLSLSKGTRDMVQRAKRAGVPVYLVSRP